MAGKSAVVRVAIVGDNSSLNRSLKQSESGLSKFGKAIAKAGILAGAAAGVALTKMAQAAIEDEAAASKLAQTLQNVTGATKEQVGAVEEWITAQGRALGVSDDELRPALAQLATATGDIAKAQELASLAMDVSAARGASLETVTKALAKAQNGSLTGLSKLGIATKDASGKALTLQQVTENLTDAFGGAAAAAAETTAGKYQILRLRLSEAGEAIGASLLPALTSLGDFLLETVVPGVESLAESAGAKLGPALQDLSGWVQDNGDDLADLGGTITSVVLPAVTTLAGIIGDLVSAFTSLPKPLQQSVILIGLAAIALGKLRPAMALNAGTFSTGIARVKQFNAELTYTETRTAAVTGALKKLAPAAQAAAGVGGLLLLSKAADETSDEMRTLENVAGGAALGFSVGGPLGAAIGALVGLLKDMRDQIIGTADAIDVLNNSSDLSAVKKEIADTEKQLADIEEHRGFNMSDFIGWDPGFFSRSFTEATGKTAELEEALANAKGRLADLEAGSDDTSEAQEKFAGVLRAAGEAAAEEAQALQDSIDAMREKRDEANRGLNAQLDYAEAMDEANQALKENGKTVDKSTEAGRANLRALTGLAGAWNDQTDAVKNQKGALGEARENFIKTATAMGLGEEAAKRLARKLLEIPTSRTTKFTLDAGQADATLRALKGRMDQIKDKSVTVTITTQNVRPQGGQAPTEEQVPNSRTLSERKADAFNNGRLLGEAFARGAAKGGKLLVDLFGPIAEITADEIKTGLADATALVEKITNKRIKDNDKAAKRRKAILKSLRDEYAALRANMKAQKEQNKLLEDADATYQSLLQRASDIAKTFVSFGDISGLGQTAAGNTTLAKLLRDLSQRAADAAEFQRVVQQLAAQGLNEEQVNQLLSQGPSALAVAKAIAQGGTTAIQEVNRLSGEIAASGSALGLAIADQFSPVSTSMAKAYVDQIKAEQTRLNETAQNMAKALVKQLNLELGLGNGGDGNGGKGGKGGGGKRQQLSNAAVMGDGGRTPVQVRLTAQQVSQLERGREIQMDLDAFRSAGGRARR